MFPIKSKTYMVALCCLFIFILFPTVPVWADFTEVTILPEGLPNVFRSSVAWGDYDNDGDLDILLSGHTGGAYRSRVYRNNGDNTFIDIEAGLPSVYYSSVAWGDYDNDGDLDILITGYYIGGCLSRVYRNDGSDTFTNIDPDGGTLLIGISEGSVAWGDYDNDGDLDILLTGQTYSSDIITRIYRNDGNDTFTERDLGLIGVYRGSVAWGDYDNDGDLDILLTGDTDSYSFTSLIYRNDGNDTFTERDVGLTAVGFSSVAWGDYDNDGDFDILLTGCPTLFSSTSRVYRNDGNDDFEYVAGLQAVISGSAAWGDYDNDGDLDILLTGHNGDIFSPVFYSRVYRNDGNDDFNNVDAIEAVLTEVSEGSVAWGDYDNDGDLDILLTGNSGNDSSPIAFSRVYRNDGDWPGFTANDPPNAPSGLRIDYDYVEELITLAWDQASDDHTPAAGLTYNVRIGSSPGAGDIKGPMADCISGLRRIPAVGNANQRLQYYMPLTSDVRYWSVQAVDTAFAGSVWSGEGQFGGGTESLTVSKSGSGDGTVTDDLSQIDCGGDCEAVLLKGDSITLTAVPESDTDEFTGWSGGGCSGTGDCTVTMDASKTVTANFNLAHFYYALSVGKEGEGLGSVTSDPLGIDCGDGCINDFLAGTTVTLTANPDAASEFSGWTGGECSGTGDCTVTMDASKTVTATFYLSPDLFELTVGKNGDGFGTVTSGPAGIDCGGDCRELYAEGGEVTLTGTPDAGSALDGWIGADCPGNGPCLVTMDHDYLVTATFNVDGDADGISDVVENSGPNNGDGNGDGILDSQQANVATFRCANGGWATLVSPEGTTLVNVQTTGLASPDGLPDGHQCPCGSLGFEVHGVQSGGSAQVILILHTANASINNYVKYGPTPDNNADHWYEFLSSDGGPGAVITTGDGKTTIVFNFVDGQKGDADLTANSIIVDPGAPSIKTDDEGGGGGSGGGAGGCFLHTAR